jgi:hypothetical protein
MSDGSRIDDRLRALDEASSARLLDPFTAVPWDDPAAAITDRDRRWTTFSEMIDPLCATEWYADQDEGTRVRYALARVAIGSMIAIELESSLQIGLATFIRSLPLDSLEVRYVCHEIAEEARHIQMFHELTLRIAAVCPQVPIPDTVAGWILPDTMLRYHDRDRPEVLLLTALAVEEPVQQIQRAFLRQPAPAQNPLLASVFRLHTTEEARHIAYARLMLRERIAGLARRDLNRLRYVAPGTLHAVCNAFVATPHLLVEPFAIPHAVLESPEYRGALRRSTGFAAAPCVSFARRSGILTERLEGLWRDVL